MSSYLKWSDITIIIIAVIGNITGQFLTAFSKSMTMLWVAYVLWMLWNCITTISRSIRLEGGRNYFWNFYIRIRQQAHTSPVGCCLLLLLFSIFCSDQLMHQKLETLVLVYLMLMPVSHSFLLSLPQVIDHKVYGLQ